jgi:long-chain acyl-CoA synthetase
MFPPILSHKDEFDLTSLESINGAMAPIPMEVRREFMEELGAETWLGAGQTECFPATHFFPPKYQFSKEGNIWGQTAPLNKHSLMNHNGDLLDKRDEIGEIVTRGANIMEGYLDPENETGSWENGWLRWGDMGKFDEDDLLVFTDRKKDAIKTGGENVSSSRVEEVLLDHPDIENAAVVGLPHAKWTEAVTGVVHASGEVSREELIEYCKQSNLPEFAIPKDILFVEEFPKTETGKIQKARLRDEYSSHYET